MTQLSATQTRSEPCLKIATAQHRSEATRRTFVDTLTPQRRRSLLDPAGQR